LDLIHFKYGEALLTAGQGERAAKEFLAATKVERAEPGLVTMAHLYAARAYDVAGKRDEALAQYKEVLARPNVYDAHDEAKRGLKQAYKAEAIVRAADVSTN
jgi:predicted Zn-dependent protease